MQPSMGRCMRFDTRDTNTSIRIEAGGARLGRIVTAGLQRLHTRLGSEFFSPDSSETVPRSRRRGICRWLLGRASAGVEGASLKKMTRKLSDSRAAGLQASAVWIPPLCLCYIDRLCYVFLR